MKISRIEDTDRGWFIGNFAKAAFQTDACEVSYKFFPRGTSCSIFQRRTVCAELACHTCLARGFVSVAWRTGYNPGRREGYYAVRGSVSAHHHQEEGEQPLVEH